MLEEKQEKDKKGDCIIHHTGSEENPNLCCCYIIDSDGRFEDPCYHPAADCC